MIVTRHWSLLQLVTTYATKIVSRPKTKGRIPTCQRREQTRKTHARMRRLHSSFGTRPQVPQRRQLLRFYPEIYLHEIQTRLLAKCYCWCYNYMQDI